MPFSLSTIRCRLNSDLDSALFDYQERLGDQLLKARETLEQLKLTANDVSSNFCVPLRKELDAVLATANVSTESVIDALSLIEGDSTDDIEAAIDDRFDMTIIGGRFIPDGSFNLSAIQRLSRLLGSFEAIYDLAPDLNDFAADTGSDREFRAVRTPTPRFFLISTYTTVTVTPATSCTPEVVVTSEATVGVDIPLSVAADSLGVEVSSLKIYIFWFGTPSASSFIRSKATLLGLTNDQFVDAVSLTSSADFIVEKIEDPSSIPRLTGFFGEDAEDVVRRVVRPIGFETDPFSIAEIIRDSITKSSGGSGPSGAPDLSSSAFSLLSVLDIDKTFQIAAIARQLAEGVEGASAEALEFAEGISAAVESQLMVLSTILNESQEVVTSVMNDVMNLESIVDLLFGDLSNGTASCLFGNAFNPVTSFPDVGTPSLEIGIGGIGGPGTPGTPGVPTNNPLQNLVDIIETQTATVNSFISDVKSLFTDVSSISCMGSFVAGSQSMQNTFPGGILECASQTAEAAGFDFPDNFSDGLGVVKVVMDLITKLFDTTIANIRGLRTSVSSLSLTLRANLEQGNFAGSSSLPSGSGCAPAEATRLADLLQERSRAGFTDNTSTIEDI